MIIYSIIILILSLLLSSIHCFYILNAGILEECSSGESMTFLNKFDTTKMNCLNQLWQQTSVRLEYSCTQNKLNRLWSIKIEVKKNFNWPSKIFFLTETSI